MVIAAESRKGRTASRSRPGNGRGELALPGRTTSSTRTTGSDEPSASTGAPSTAASGNAAETDDLTRFLSSFHTIFGQAVNAALPAIFDLFRADAQPRNGAHTSQADVDRSLADFLSLLQPVVSQLVPFLVEQVTAENRSRSSRGMPETLDPEAQDRFWGALVAAAVPLVVNNLPAVVHEVGNAFAPGGVFGGLFGGRSYPQSVPREEIVLPVADREMVARFWGPFFNVVGTALSSCLPDLFNVVQGRGVPRDHAITWDDLTVRNRLWDNDVIVVAGIGDAADPNTIELVLELAWPKTWYKGIQVQDDNGSLITQVGVQDNARISETSVPADYILRGGYLVFMKAKLFGIHTAMYRMATGGMEQLRGRRVHVLWAAD